MDSNWDSLSDEFLFSRRHLLQLFVYFRFGKTFPLNCYCSVIDMVFIPIFGIIQVISTIFIYDGVIIIGYFICMCTDTYTHEFLLYQSFVSLFPQDSIIRVTFSSLLSTKNYPASSAVHISQFVHPDIPAIPASGK